MDQHNLVRYNDYMILLYDVQTGDVKLQIDQQSSYGLNLFIWEDSLTVTLVCPFVSCLDESYLCFVNFFFIFFQLSTCLLAFAH